MAVAAAAVTGGPLPLAFLSLSSLSFSFCFLSVRPLFLFLSFPKPSSLCSNVRLARMPRSSLIIGRCNDPDDRTHERPP